MTILYSMKTKVSNESNIVIQTLSTTFNSGHTASIVSLLIDVNFLLQIQKLSIQL